VEFGPETNESIHKERGAGPGNHSAEIERPGRESEKVRPVRGGQIKSRSGRFPSEEERQRGSGERRGKRFNLTARQPH